MGRPVLVGKSHAAWRPPPRAAALYDRRMSLLMFQHEEQSALILTDTLATNTEGEPIIFQSKAWAIPKLNMAMAVTGLGNLGSAWNDFLHSSLVALDIDMVDRYATEQLQKIWSDLEVENEPDQKILTGTVYHFGFPEGSDRLVRYVYRSANGFESELWDEPGFGIKPQPTGDFNAPDDLDDWIRLAEQVRAEQDSLPAKEKIYIGGELFLLVIQDGQSQIARVHRFDDYEQAWLAMNALLNR